MEKTMDKFFTDLEDMWGNAIYCDPPDVQSDESPSFVVPPLPPPPPKLPTSTYLPPTNPYALTIWVQCNFRQKGEEKGTIKRELLAWATKNKYLSLRSDGVSYIDWEMNDTAIRGSWSAFVLWFFCSCPCTKVTTRSEYSL
jgi:hypothetical protein